MLPKGAANIQRQRPLYCGLLFDTLGNPALYIARFSKTKGLKVAGVFTILVGVTPIIAQEFPKTSSCGMTSYALKVSNVPLPLD